MARLRFTLRAYLLEGHPPDVALAMCSAQLDIEEDGHFATALAGIGDVSTGEITLANAGHLNPLLASPQKAVYMTTDVGPPLGITTATYNSNTFVLPAGSALVAFTDGLVERRGEDIDVGLQRLAEAATASAASLDDLLTALVTQMAHQGAEDDIAVLALRRTAPGGRPRVRCSLVSGVRLPP